ncbi:MAG: hypothetical protein ACI9FN_003626 [Saprospiraceae bacterium]|jgi:hypothetical protein
MDNKKVFMLVVLILLIAGFFSVFQIKEVPDVEWTEDYSYSSKDPFGVYAFQELVSTYYKDQGIELESRAPLFADPSLQSNGLYINIAYQFEFSAFADSLLQYVSDGNTALLIADYQDDVIYDVIEHIKRAYFFDQQFTIHSNSDSFVFKYLVNDLEYASDWLISPMEITPIDSNTIDNQSYKGHHLIRDSMFAMVSLPYGDGKLYIHSLPITFSNMAFIQDSIAGYIRETLSLFDPDIVYLDTDMYQAKKSNIKTKSKESWINRRNDFDYSQSKLSYVLSQPGLKWAYYLSLLGLLLYVISRGKRRQKLIPTLPLKENTSLEYITTISNLYQSEQKPYKLVKHLKLTWWHWIKKRYYITPDIENAIQKIALKSQVPEKEIRNIINRFESAQNNHLFQSDQLISFYNKLETFYKKCK